MLSAGANINYQSKAYCVGTEDIEFLSDLTYKNAVGETVHEQEIFDTIFSLIDHAQEYILMDMFLFNSYTGKSEEIYRRLCFELMSKLVKKKKQVPPKNILFMYYQLCLERYGLSGLFGMMGKYLLGKKL